LSENVVEPVIEPGPLGLWQGTLTARPQRRNRKWCETHREQLCNASSTGVRRRTDGSTSLPAATIEGGREDRPAAEGLPEKIPEPRHIVRNVPVIMLHCEHLPKYDSEQRELWQLARRKSSVGLRSCSLQAISTPNCLRRKKKSSARSSSVVSLSCTRTRMPFTLRNNDVTQPCQRTTGTRVMQSVQRRPGRSSSPVRQRILFSRASTPALELAQPLSPWVKRPGREAVHSHPLPRTSSWRSALLNKGTTCSTDLRLGDGEEYARRERR
jgi:hypothetical protein